MAALTPHPRETSDVVAPALPSSDFASLTSSSEGSAIEVAPSTQRILTLSPLKWISILGGLGVVSLMTFVLCLGFGAERISFFQVVSFLAQGPFLQYENLEFAGSQLLP